MPIRIANTEYYSDVEMASLFEVDTSTIRYNAKKGIFGEPVRVNRNNHYPREKVDEIVVPPKIEVDRSLFYTQTEVMRILKMHRRTTLKMFTPDVDYIEVQVGFFRKEYLFYKEKVDHAYKKKEDYYTPNEAAKYLNIPEQTLRHWIRAGKFENNVLIEKNSIGRNRYYILKTTIHKMLGTENMFDRDLYYKLEEMRMVLGSLDDREIRKLKAEGRFGEIKKVGNATFYLKEKVELILKSLDIKIDYTNFYTTQEVAKMFGVATVTVRIWHNQERRFGDNVLKVRQGKNHILYFSKEAVHELLENDGMGKEYELYYSSEKTLELLGATSSTMSRLRKSGTFREEEIISVGNNKEYDRYLYLREKIDRMAEERLGIVNLTLYSSHEEVLLLLGVDDQTLRSWLISGRFENQYYMLKGNPNIEQCYYLKDAVVKIVQEGSIEESRSGSGVMFSNEDIENKYSISSNVCTKWINKGLFGDSIIVDNSVYFKSIHIDLTIPEGFSVLLTKQTMAKKVSFDIRKYNATNPPENRVTLIKKWVYNLNRLSLETLYREKDVEEIENFLSNGISHYEMAKKLKVTDKAAFYWVYKNKFKKAIHSDKGWVISQEEFRDFEKVYKAENVEKFVDDFSKLPYIEQLHYRLNFIPIYTSIERTTYFLREYLIARQKRTEGSLRYQYSTSRQLTNLYKKIVDGLSVKELYLYTDEQLLRFAENLALGHAEYTVFRDFTQYLKRKVECLYKGIPLIVEPREYGSSKKEIYTPDEYLLYFEFLGNVEVHLKQALSSRDYTSVWLYTGMHLNCAFRGTDISSIPSLNITVTDIETMEYFRNNRLNKAQAAVIIKQVSDFYDVIDPEAKKNDSTYVFTIHPELMYAMATAFIIADLHSKLDDDDFLIVCGKRRHREIDAEVVNKTFSKTYVKSLVGDPLNLPPFDSIKMNRSFISYMHHSLENSSEHPALAYALVKRWRGHKGEDTTGHYILMTNKDGTLNQACKTLFSRGQFGWVYEAFSDLLCLEERVSRDEQTKIIRELREQNTLGEIEFASELVLAQVLRRNHVINRLVTMDKDHLSQLMRKIFAGESKARFECGSCWLGKDQCPTPLAHCLECEEYIPEVETLMYLGEEFIKSIDVIISTEYEAEIIKQIQRISKLFVILYEAEKAFGVDYLSVYVDINVILERCNYINYTRWQERVLVLLKEHDHFINNKRIPFVEGNC
ncbi:helix-turn-helix domain-containing protein [Paenibacillus sp. TRM 82003]|nr:helix-turn-helix domain-containing protein [Paenibacillus sp. TRM 82003]MCI3923416.1 helix-turn-helix domain-containing protein [Paenibacillus sp. TRM 82003]